MKFYSVQKYSFTILLFCILSLSHKTFAGSSAGRRVAVIAPSVSTSMEARSIMREQHWTEVSLRNAEAILVVVRSAIYEPLKFTYDCVKDLKQDADFQLNISGTYFHVYVYSFNDDLSINSIKHIYYEARD